MHLGNDLVGLLHHEAFSNLQFEPLRVRSGLSNRILDKLGDRSLIESLSDPLTHMVRNAVDHGIELPNDRARAGKPRQGLITIDARHEAGQVVVEIADDGQGIDPERIAKVAVAKGLITADEANGMSGKDKMALLFLPGLSTAKQLSDVSGRGVGMDVVKTNLDRLGGKVEIISVAGSGTTFRIKLPLTLAIIPSLIVSVEGRTICDSADQR